MAIFYTDSGSFNDLKITGSILVSGSLVVTGSAYVRGLETTPQPSLVSIDTSTGQLYTATTSSFTASYATTASYALNATSAPTSFIATGSVTASVNIGTEDIFTVTSASLTEFAVRGTGVRIGNIITDTHTVTGSLNISGSTTITGSLRIRDGITGSLLGTASFAQTSSKVIGGTINYIARWTDSRTLSIGSIQDDNTTVTIGVRTIIGSANTATGANSFAQGNSVSATGQNAHAQGVFAIASGNNSHAEGYQTTASNDQSHAEGNQTWASGIGSHAEGSLTRAIGQYSHAEGQETIASGSYQLAIGKYNRRGNITSLFIIGNGTGDADVDRSDVVRVETSGVQISGSLTVSSGSTEFQVLGTGVKMGNTITDIHTVTGSFNISGSTFLGGNVTGTGSSFEYFISSSNILSGSSFRISQTATALNESLNFKLGAYNIETNLESPNTASFHFGSRNGGLSFLGVQPYIQGVPTFIWGGAGLGPNNISRMVMGVNTTAEYTSGLSYPSASSNHFYINTTFSSPNPVTNERRPLYIGAKDIRLFVGGIEASESFNRTPEMMISASGEVTIKNVLVLPYQNPLPSAKPTGSIATSGSGATFIGLFLYNGTSWIKLSV